MSARSGRGSLIAAPRFPGGPYAIFPDETILDGIFDQIKRLNDIAG